jgi:hypothetical protein
MHNPFFLYLLLYLFLFFFFFFLFSKYEASRNSDTARSLIYGARGLAHLYTV